MTVKKAAKPRKNNGSSFLQKLKYMNQDQLRYLSQSVILEEAINPHIIRITMLTISSAIFFFLAWAGITTISEIAKAPGEIVPKSYVQSIQHLEGGIIANINVIEGQRVDSGDVLMVLDGIEAKQNLSELEVKQLSLKMQSERLKAFINNRSPDFSKVATGHSKLKEEQLKIYQSMVDLRETEKKVMGNQLLQKQDSLKILESKLKTLAVDIELAKEESKMKTQLHSKGYTNKVVLLEAQKKLNQVQGDYDSVLSQIAQAKEAIIEYENRLKSVDAKHSDNAYQQLDNIEVQISQNNEAETRLKSRVKRLEVRSPVKGIVKGMQVKTIGGVVKPGQILMEVVPMNDNLLVECHVSPNDIGHVRVGQEATIKVSSYDFSRYGTINGKLEYISATTFSNEEGERYYLGRISLNQDYVGENPSSNKIIPGMTVEADIVTGQKTILAYLLKPIHTSISTAFTER